jgi:lipopolysaccharide transport system ATP-binding protein
VPGAPSVGGLGGPVARPPMSTDVVVAVRDLSKRFKLYDNPWHRLLEWVTFDRVVRHGEFWALQDISFEVLRGECLGIIGVNGAGKSTLLKILSRTLHPTRGSFQVNGRLVSLLELGTGFHPDLTGRQNLYQSAALLGFPETYVRGRLAEILDFAQIGEFIDQPVKRYSSGMFVRLAFSLFAHLEPDVYIVDEALAVGDVFFQQKCFRRFTELKRGGCTILFVTHDMGAVTHLCDRALLLSGGKLAAQGDPVSVVHDYFALSGQTFAPAGPAFSPSVAGHDHLEVPAPVQAALSVATTGQHGGAGTRATRIEAFAVADPDGKPTWVIPCGGRLRFWYLVTAHQPCDDLNVGIHFYDRRGILVFAIGTANLGLELPRLEPGERVVCAIDVTLALQPGEYTLLPQTGGLTGGRPEPGLLHDRLEGLPPIVVTPSGPAGRSPFYGLVGLAADAAWTQES